MTELKSTGRQFDAPPVFETALSLQFEELEDFRTVHFGRFHELVRESFPIAEDHSRADRIVEEFPKALRPRLQLVPKPPGPERVWFRDRTDGTLLLQVQPDRFALNWRRSSDCEDYPSFVVNGKRFVEEFQRFVGFCSEQELGPVRTNLCELVYVNRIFPEQDESLAECFERVLSGLDWSRSSSFLPAPEHVTFNRVYPIDCNRGRLYVECSTWSPRSDGEMIQLKLTARVLCPPDSDPTEAIQLAHDWVVNGFVEVTDAEARRLRWKEKT